MKAAFLCLRQCILHDAQIEALDLDVHLDGRDPVARARNLEVHVAEMVFSAENVGEDRVFLPFLDQSHRDTGNRGVYRNAGVEQRQRPAAHGRHR